jgi:peptidoglycan-N-acetylglucosamine deacetylase
MIPNPIVWPNGARCAVAFSFDVDVDSAIRFKNPGTADTKLVALSLMRSEVDISVQRILEIYRAYSLQQTFFVPGWSIERYPEMVRQMIAGGHEIGHHGYLHEKMNQLSPEEEREAILKGIDAVVNATGQRPKGFRAPSYAFSQRTLPFLIEEGFLYDSSLMGGEMPYFLENGGRRLFELPVDSALDDWSYFVSLGDLGQVLPLVSPKQAFESYRAEFDAAWKHGTPWICVWHPFASGRLSRLEAMVELIDHMRAKGGVWFTTLSAMAEHLQRCVDSGWKPVVCPTP